MLILSRRPGEEIVIGDNVHVRVVKIKGKVVRLALDAPRDVRIYRGEVQQRIDLERLETPLLAGTEGNHGQILVEGDWCTS